MALLSALFVGLVVGTLGGWLIRDSFESFFLNAFFGIAGALLGDAVYYLLATDKLSLFSLAGVLCQAVGALIFVLVFSLLSRAVPKQENIKETEV